MPVVGSAWNSVAAQTCPPRTILTPTLKASLLGLSLLIPTTNVLAGTLLPSQVSQQSATVGNGGPAAELAVGKAYYLGATGGRPDYRQARKWLTLASNDGSVEAGAWLGSLFLFGRGGAQEIGRGSELILAAADQGNPVGLRFKGVMYQAGLGVAKDAGKAFALYSSAAQSGDARSMTLEALSIMNGQGVQQDFMRGFILLGNAADAGDAWASVHLGDVYSGTWRSSMRSAPLSSRRPFTMRASIKQPQSNQIAVDYGKAMELYQVAAKLGNGVGAYKAAEFLFAGNQVPQDYKQAFALYTQAAASGIANGHARLGLFCEKGLAGPADLVQAYFQYTVAELLGSDLAGPTSAATVWKQLSADQQNEAMALVKASPAMGQVSQTTSK